MKTLRGSIGGAVSGVLVLGGVLSGCGQKINKSAREATSARTVDKSIAAANDNNIAKSLQTIKEKYEGKSHLLVLEKEYWLNKRIWVSVGVERSSVTGMSGSVMGYIPTFLRKVNQLLVLDRDNTGRFASSVVTPETALNAYPIVDEDDTSIVVDVSSPRTEYGLTNMGVYTEEDASTELKPRLEYVKDVTITDQGVAFKNVVNALSPKKLYEAGDGSPEETAGLDPYSVSLTIRTDWRLPNPTQGYQPLKSAAQPIGFFYGDAKLSNGGLANTKFVNRIATTQKQKWEMSANTPELYQQAVREGVLAWNDALGSDVLEVSLAKPGKDLTDPNTSNVTWDDNRTVGFAFANWRDDPDTGEIMQGQVYMSGNMWAEQGGLVYDLRRLEKLLREALDASREAQRRESQAKPQNPEEPQVPGCGPGGEEHCPQQEDKVLLSKVRHLQKQMAKSVAQLKKQLKSPSFIKRGFVSLNPEMHDEIAHSKGFCQREVRLEDLRDIVSAVVLVQGELESTTDLNQLAAAQDSQQKAADGIARTLTHMPYPADNVTRAQFQANVVRSVVMHEVGHTLGLRHNFMGSLETSAEGKVESASIMDYNDLVIDAQFDKPGDSDRAVINMGYKREAPQKAFKFCTDENVEQGVPGCHRHDYSADPVDFFMTNQETNLLVGLYFGQRGDMGRLISSVNRALSTNLEFLNYVNLPAEEGAQIDPNFANQQSKAFAALLASRKMYDLPFPTELTSIYDGLSRLVFGLRLNAGAAQSSLKTAIISDLGQTVLDEKGLMEKDSRLAGVMGLLKLQDGTARQSLKGLIATLGEQSSKNDAERNLDSRMMDEYVQNATKQALDSYFNVGSQEKQ